VRLRRLVPVAILAVAVPAVALAACSPAADSPRSSGSADASATGAPTELTVFAAASLEAVLAEVRDSYETSHPGVTLTVSTDSSAAVETKIEQGAPADVFLSADTVNARKLVDAGLADGPIALFAGNHLAVIVPAANPARIGSPLDLGRAGVKVIAAGDAVPITTYAEEAIAKLAALPGTPPDFAARYAANVVSREDNVAGIVTKVALGEGDAGIVYVTDAKSSRQVRTVAIPDAANVPATYGGVVVGASPHRAAAHAFLSWLSGPDGQSILASFGFLPTS
jgi:molybdate transport system substrate-binding protein